MERQLKLLQAHLGEVVESLKKIKEENTALQTQLALLQSEVENLNNQLNDQTVLNKTLAEQNTELQNALTALTSQLQVNQLPAEQQTNSNLTAQQPPALSRPPSANKQEPGKGPGQGHNL